MSKSDLFKRHVLEQLYGKPESDNDHNSEDESSGKPELEESSVPAVSVRKIYGAALPPNWPQDSSGQDLNGKQQQHTTADHSSSHSGSSSSDSEEDYHKRRKRKRKRHRAGNAQTSEQDSSRRNAESGDSHKQNNSSNSQIQLSKNQKRKQKKKRREKRRKEEERRQQQQTDSSPQEARQPGTFVYEGSARSTLEQEENKRKEDLLQRLKDVTSFLDAVVDVYNRDMTLQDKSVETWSGRESQALQIAVLRCEDSLREVELLCRAKSTALLGHPGLASEARLQLCQQSSLSADLIKFVTTMVEYWITDVMKKA